MTKAEGQPVRRARPSLVDTGFISNSLFPVDWATYLKAMMNPETPEEHQIARESQARVRENTRAIQKHLPPSTHADHTRMTW